MKRWVVCSVEDLPRGSKRIITVGGREIGILNVEGRLFALNNLCPHAGAPLCLGDTTGTTQSTGPYQVRWVSDGQVIRCPWHGWEFDLESGRTISDPPRYAKTYRIFVEDGIIVVEAKLGGTDEI